MFLLSNRVLNILTILLLGFIVYKSFQQSGRPSIIETYKLPSGQKPKYSIDLNKKYEDLSSTEKIIYNLFKDKIEKEREVNAK